MNCCLHVFYFNSAAVKFVKICLFFELILFSQELVSSNMCWCFKFWVVAIETRNWLLWLMDIKLSVTVNSVLNTIV